MGVSYPGFTIIKVVANRVIAVILLSGFSKPSLLFRIKTSNVKFISPMCVISIITFGDLVYS